MKSTAFVIGFGASVFAAPLFGTSLNMLKDLINKSAPVINIVSEAVGGPAYEGSDAIAAINGVTPQVDTFANAAAPYANYFGLSEGEKEVDEDENSVGGSTGRS